MPVMAEVEGQEEPFKTLTEGDTGEIVRFAQYLLNFASLYTRTVKPVEPNGVYGRETTESVVDFQRTFGLSPTGDIDSDTFNLLLSLREAAYVRLGDSAYIPEVVPFGGRELRLGSRGDDVVRLQNFLNCVADLYSDTIGRVRVTGVFNAETRDAVRAVQRIHGMPQTGTVKEQDWEIITALYNDCAAARFLLPGQYPGYLIERIRNREVGF
jgi:peptidoglycan hydrolase-like protein with peptidoglycan-binding domain